VKKGYLRVYFVEVAKPQNVLQRVNSQKMALGFGFEGGDQYLEGVKDLLDLRPKKKSRSIAFGTGFCFSLWLGAAFKVLRMRAYSGGLLGQVALAVEAPVKKDVDLAKQALETKDSPPIVCSPRRSLPNRVTREKEREKEARARPLRGESRAQGALRGPP
jgi:hypothetical protein